MNGVLSSSYAFVEQLEQTHMDEKIFTIDINKCRRNILYNSKYNYPIFTVMDEIKPFNENNYKKCGLFFIETKQHFPLHGNGWYTYPMIKYCLKKKLITFDNIKFIIESSLELPNNYFNSFIDDCLKNESLDKSNEKIHEIYNNMEVAMDMIDPKKSL
jgi:hypothetical protein